MKVKKKILIITSIIFSMLICACGSENAKVNGEKEKSIIASENENNLMVKAIKGNLDFDGTSIDSEDEFCNHQNMSSFIAPDGQENIQIDLFGKVYEGKYKETYMQGYMHENYFRKKYDFEYGAIDIHEKSGKVVMFVGKLPYFDHEITKEEAKSEIEKMADEDIPKEKYKFAEVEFDVDVSERLFGFQYVRYINDIPTVARYMTIFGPDGCCYSHVCEMIDEFNELYDKYSEEEISEMAKKLDSEQAHKMIEEKVASVFGEYDSYEIADKKYTLLEDGSLALACYLHVYCDEEAEHEGEYHYFSLLVCFEDE